MTGFDIVLFCLAIASFVIGVGAAWWAGWNRGFRAGVKAATTHWMRQHEEVA